jgi:hypothetical protein
VRVATTVTGLPRAAAIATAVAAHARPARMLAPYAGLPGCSRRAVPTPPRPGRTRTPHARSGPPILGRILTHEHTIGVQRDMAAHSHSSHAIPRYAAIAALFTALETLISDYQSAPEHERVQRWSDDAERITGEVARHLAIARARLSVVPPHDAERG